MQQVMKRIRAGLYLSMALCLTVGNSLAAASLPAPAQDATADAIGGHYILFVGNSFTYVNDLPTLFTSVASSQAGLATWHAEMIASPGASIADHARDGLVTAALQRQKWDVLVLQERGGLLACLGKPGSGDSPDCMASKAAHEKLVATAHATGARVVLLGTWGPDAIWQGQLSRGVRRMASATKADVFDAGPMLREYAKDHPKTPLFSDAILHPTPTASLLVATALWTYLAPDSSAQPRQQERD